MRFTVIATLGLAMCERVGESRAPAPAPTVTQSPVTDFAHLPIRPVVRGPAASAQKPRGKPPRLVVRRERPYYFGHLVGGESPNLPPWMPTQFGSEDIWLFHVEPDGRSVAMTGHIVILIDRDHHPEGALDFSGFRSNPGPHAPRDDASLMVDAHRVGQLVIVLGLDAEHDGRSFLAAIDATTGKSIWAIPVNDIGFTGPANFVVIGDFAVLDSGGLVVRELGAGQIVARVKTAEEGYTFDVRPDGNLHGIVRALAADGFTTEIDLDVTR